MGKFAVIGTGADAGKWAPAATAPVSGCYAEVEWSLTVSQGVDGNVTDDGVLAYFMLVKNN